LPKWAKRTSSSTICSDPARLNLASNDHDGDIIFASGVKCCFNELLSRVVRVPHEDACYLIFIDHVRETVGAKKQSIITVPAPVLESLAKTEA
jgi:catabolite regulation protein CreA